MTDRELLELAAKAAGMALDFTAGGKIVWDVSDECDHKLWDPLASDGDALRLAVKLHLTVRPATAMCGLGSFMEPAHPNADAATRRAIVRAAAEIGRNLP